MNQSICNDTATKMSETSIINVIRAIRAIQKRPEQLSIYDFVDKVNLSVDINLITNSLKTIIEMRKVENKTSNDKSPCNLTECKNTFSEGWTYLIPKPLLQKY